MNGASKNFGAPPRLPFFVIVGEDSLHSFFLDEPDEAECLAAVESAIAADDRRHAIGRRSILAGYGGAGLDRLD